MERGETLLSMAVWESAICGTKRGSQLPSGRNVTEIEEITRYWCTLYVSLDLIGAQHWGNLHSIDSLCKDLSPAQTTCGPGIGFQKYTCHFYSWKNTKSSSLVPNFAQVSCLMPDLSPSTILGKAKHRLLRLFRSMYTCPAEHVSSKCAWQTYSTLRKVGRSLSLVPERCHDR